MIHNIDNDFFSKERIIPIKDGTLLFTRNILKNWAFFLNDASSSITISILCQTREFESIIIIMTEYLNSKVL